MTLGGPQIPPYFALPIPPVPSGWTKPDQQFPTPPHTHQEYTRTPRQESQQPHSNAHQNAQQMHAQQQHAQQQHAQQQHAQQQHAQQQHAQQQHAQQSRFPHPHAPYPHTYPQHWPNYVGSGLKVPPSNPFASGVQQGMQAFFKENGERLSEVVATTLMAKIKGPYLDPFNNELGSLRTLLEEALSQKQPSVNDSLANLQSQLVDLQCTMYEFVPRTGEAHAELREELASIQRSLEASKPRRLIPSSTGMACTGECHKQAEAIKKMVRETQGSVEALRAALASRKGSPARRVRASASTRNKGKTKAPQKSSSGRRANRGPDRGAAGAIGQGIGQEALSCTALPERQRKRSPEDVKDTDRNSLSKAPRAHRESSLPASVAGEQPGRTRCQSHHVSAINTTGVVVPRRSRRLSSRTTLVDRERALWRKIRSTVPVERFVFWFSSCPPLGWPLRSIATQIINLPIVPTSCRTARLPSGRTDRAFQFETADTQMASSCHALDPSSNPSVGVCSRCILCFAMATCSWGYEHTTATGLLCTVAANGGLNSQSENYGAMDRNLIALKQ
ncbi:hypothetical protein AUP68_13995 [Ilyonectria robusta]